MANAHEMSEMFGRISPRYDLLNRLMTAGLDRSWRKKGVHFLDLKTKVPRFLDLATGTGDFAITLAQEFFLQNPNPKLYIDALDINDQMLRIARDKAKKAGLQHHIHFHQGAMEHLPFDNQQFQGITVGFGIRNAEDRKKALREMHRVLLPGGKLVILEAMPPQNPVQKFLQRAHMRVTVQILGRLLSDAQAYRYLGNSVEHFPSHQTFTDLLHQCGFQQTTTHPLTLGASTLFIAKK